MVDGLCVFGVFMLHLVSGIGLLLRGALLFEENVFSIENFFHRFEQFLRFSHRKLF